MNDPAASRRRAAAVRARTRQENTPDAQPVKISRAPASGEWQCDTCGHIDEWEDGWRWLGILEDRNGHGPIVEAVQCPNCTNPDEPTVPE